MVSGVLSILQATNISQRKVYKTQVIEVRIPTGSTRTKFQLPDEQNLRYVHLLGIETYTIEELPLSPATNTPVISPDLMKSISLTLQAYQGENFMWQQPIQGLRTMDVGGVALIPHQTFPLAFAGQRVNWPKSYIEIADTSLIPGVDVVVVLNVYYKEGSAKSRKDAKATFRNRS